MIDKPAPAVFEPWLPREGDYVRVEANPECRAFHSKTASLSTPAYGRVEFVDRTWDDPAEWLAAALADGEDEEEALRAASENLGHYYYVSDALDTGRVLQVDEHFCALEMERVEPAEARLAIGALRERFEQMTREERFALRLSAIVGRPL